MSDINKQSDSERALARLLAEALRPPEGAASDSDCPDAGLLAAYADHNLDAAETLRWEEHFAGCARCQKILAVLTVSGEEPLSEAEVQRFGRKVAAAGIGAPASEPRAVESKKVASFPRPRAYWRWVAPAVGIAAAAALWIALRPAPPRGTPAVTAQNAQNANAQPSARADESLEARANVPSPPAAASREAQPGPPGPQELKSLLQPQPLKKENAQTPSDAVSTQQFAAQADSAAAAPQPAAGLEAARAAAGAAPTAAGNSPEAKVTEESPAAASAAPPAPAAAARTAAPAAPAAAPPAANGAEEKSAGNRPLQAFAARDDHSGSGRARASRARFTQPQRALAPEPRRPHRALRRPGSDLARAIERRKK